VQRAHEWIPVGVPGADRAQIADLSLVRVSDIGHGYGLLRHIHSHSSSIQHASLGELPMVTLTIQNIPDEVYEQLKHRAAHHRRSVNSKAIVCLEQVLGSRSVDPVTFLANIRALCENLSTVFVTFELSC
jgi:antitoxin FitA